MSATIPFDCWTLLAGGNHWLVLWVCSASVAPHMVLYKFY